jgi:hypothetical protein
MPTLADVERIKAALHQLPEVKPEQRNLNNQEAVAQLQDDIRALRDKGYTWEAIADALAEQGLAIKAPTLKSYVRRASAGPSRSKKARTRKVPSTPAQEPPAASTPKPTAKAARPDESKDSDARFNAREDSSDI